ncbi:MAG: hypothetical protein FWC33_05390 [Candidatus Bathyarchaeota archaeon]|nr:hypothetical protein [Candidatus Termiticorpusculum sp.]
MVLELSKNKLLEIAFLIGFSIVVFAVFYSTISANGLILGNDNSVHLLRTQEFLDTGKISLANLGWTPPLYQILLAFLITFTGAASIEQLILLVKVSAVLANWLLLFSVYLISTRIFNKKIGVIAVSLLFACFPIFELNMWAGYTSVLGIAFMLLLFLSLPLAVDHKRYMIVAFISAFTMVLAHQLAMFISVLILAPVILFLIVKSKGKGIKALIFVVGGGGLAFFLYYTWAMLPYLGGLIEHVFFAQKAMVYQLPSSSLSAFWTNFGFVLLLGVAGLFITTRRLLLEKKYVSAITLLLGFVVPLILMYSYVFGLYLPFHWFVYYIMPFMTIFAAVLVIFVADKTLTYYKTHKTGIKRVYVKITVVGLIVLSCFALVMRGDTLSVRISDGVVFYSAADPLALQAGNWLKDNYSDSATVIATAAPGFWFGIFSEKNVVVATDPAVERTVLSESILGLSYEIETPITLLRAYEAKGNISSENYVFVNDVWRPASFCSTAGDFLSYNIDDTYKEVDLSQMTRHYTLTGDKASQTITIIYANDDILVTQTLQIQNTSYTTQVAWTITPVNRTVSNVTLYLTIFFYLSFNFDIAYLPGIMNWENPWDNPSDMHNTQWAVTDFSKNILTDDYIAVYDTQNQVYYALKYNDLPDWGNIGALGNKKIDAIRFSYTFEQLKPGTPAAFSYQTLAFSEDSYQQNIPLTQIKNMFTTQPAEHFTIDSRDYFASITENNVKFIVYDKLQLDPKFVRNSAIELIYSNDRYAIFIINT